MSREEEKQIISQMILIYCRKKHHSTDLCKECEELNQYALNRLENCPYGDNKTFCSNCNTHCYTTKQRVKIREVMYYSGPRMIFYNPRLVLMHFVSKFK